MMFLAIAFSLVVVVVIVVFCLLLYRQLRLPIPRLSSAYNATTDVLFDAASEKSIRQGYTYHKAQSVNADVIVIGSGAGGLTSAVFLSQQGYRVLVLEQHDVCGGCTHTFTDRGWEFDVGIHYVGQEIWNKQTPFRLIFDIVTGGKVDWQPLHTEYTTTYTDSSSDDGVYDRVFFGRRLIKIRAGTKRLVQDLLDRFPQEHTAIHTYFHTTITIWKQAQMYLALKVVLPICVMTWMTPYVFPSWYQYTHITTAEYMRGLTHNQQLIDILTYIYFDYGSLPSSSSFAAHAVAANYFYRGTAYPIGGPSQIAKHAVRVLAQYGSCVLVRAAVSHILINQRNRAIGVQMQRSGDQLFAPIIISATGATHTYCSLIGRSNTQHLSTVQTQVQALLTDPQLKPAASHLSLFFGFTINDPPHTKQLPRWNVFVFPASDDVDRSGREWAGVEADADAVMEAQIGCCFVMFACMKDPTYHQRHPNQITGQIICEAKYEWFLQWAAQKTRQRDAVYQQMKQRLIDRLLHVLYEHYPQLKPSSTCRLDYCELGTPLTNEHYLGSPQGSSYGLSHTGTRLSTSWLRPQTPIAGLFLSGQDVCMAGLYGAMMGGLFCAAAIDRRIIWNHLNVVVGCRLFPRVQRA